MRPALFYLSCLALTILLLLSLLNIELYTKKAPVLGVKTEVPQNQEVEFWHEFLKQNPGYFDGWLELYNLTKNEDFLQKAKEINPNYF